MASRGRGDIVRRPALRGTSGHGRSSRRHPHRHRLPPPAVAMTKTGPDGTYLVDGTGKSLYLFAIDTPTKSNCTGACAAGVAAVDHDGQTDRRVRRDRVEADHHHPPDGSTQVVYNWTPALHLHGRRVRWGDQRPGPEQLRWSLVARLAVRHRHPKITAVIYRSSSWPRRPGRPRDDRRVTRAGRAPSRRSPARRNRRRRTGEVTFYLSLPATMSNVTAAATAVSTPGSPGYRHFSTLAQAAGRLGATDAQIAARGVIDRIARLAVHGRSHATVRPGDRHADGSGRRRCPHRWPSRRPRPPTPFTTYTLPREVPDALEPSGTSRAVGAGPGLRPGRRNRSRADAERATAPEGAKPFPINTGSPIAAELHRHPAAAAPRLHTAADADRLRRGHAASAGVRYAGDHDRRPRRRLARRRSRARRRVLRVRTAARHAGPGRRGPAAINSPGTETPLDLQTAAAVAPNAQIRLVQTTPADLLDGFSRALARPERPARRHLAVVRRLRARGEPRRAAVHGRDQRRARDDRAHRRLFVRGGRRLRLDHVRPRVPGTTLSYPAVSPFVTAVGGTRLTLGPGNHRVAETDWNDSVFGALAAGGGAQTRLQSRPAYQDGANTANHRGVPDVSALADIVPGWPVVVSSVLQTVGGTSGSTPFIAAATALVDATQRQQGNRRSVSRTAGSTGPRSSSRPPSSTSRRATTTSQHVGCCHATAGYDAVSGLGVPNWATLPATLPPPG